MDKRNTILQKGHPYFCLRSLPVEVVVTPPRISLLLPALLVLLGLLPEAADEDVVALAAAKRNKNVNL